MKLEKIITADGSNSLALVGQNEQYHSKHGSLLEAKHVYINSGLDFYRLNHQKKETINILEVGFGTGLNSLLSSFYAHEKQVQINYTSLEPYPLKWEEIRELNYPELLHITLEEFKKIHDLHWGNFQKIKTDFYLKKLQLKLEKIDFDDEFDVVFFDAFGPRTQPELWEKSVFQKVYRSMKDEAVLVTYSANGQVRRNMLAVGFQVKKILGPPGKREMLRAIKS